jgi:hypothetical protein
MSQFHFSLMKPTSLLGYRINDGHINVYTASKMLCFILPS